MWLVQLVCPAAKFHWFCMKWGATLTRCSISSQIVQTSDLRTSSTTYWGRCELISLTFIVNFALDHELFVFKVWKTIEFERIHRDYIPKTTASCWLAIMRKIQRPYFQQHCCLSSAATARQQGHEQANRNALSLVPKNILKFLKK